ncbi:tobamovirus multiplication 1 [Actinidia rufa]|uniref:Tobamovirus multiplication 1 n=1 Tax=Actinidia rufa TaxID=165716 RepID=A0A7J0FX10_9ERIC|nr:tobamovirus multiplication 1 [Actinidia rufa]
MTRMPLSLPSIDWGGLSSNWWDEIDESVQWQDGIFFTLCAAYALVSAVALIALFGC